MSVIKEYMWYYAVTLYIGCHVPTKGPGWLFNSVSVVIFGGSRIREFFFFYLSIVLMLLS